MKNQINVSEMSLTDLREIAKAKGVKKIFTMRKEDLVKEIEKISAAETATPAKMVRTRSARVQAKVSEPKKEDEKPLSKKIQAILDKTDITKTEKFKRLRKAGMKPSEISKSTNSNYSFVYGVLTRAAKHGELELA